MRQYMQTYLITKDRLKRNGIKRLENSKQSYLKCFE